MVLSGTQFTMGGDHSVPDRKRDGVDIFGVVNAAGIGIIFYLAMVSAVAYTLWSCAVAWNDVSRVAIFGFVILCQCDLSALVLGEVRQHLIMGSLIALFSCLCGNLVVKQKKSS